MNKWNVFVVNICCRLIILFMQVILMVFFFVIGSSNNDWMSSGSSGETNFIMRYFLAHFRHNGRTNVCWQILSCKFIHCTCICYGLKLIYGTNVCSFKWHYICECQLRKEIKECDNLFFSNCLFLCVDEFWMDQMHLPDLNAFIQFLE